MEKLRGVALGIGARHLELFRLCLGQVAVPGYFLQVSFELFLTTSQKLLSDADLYVLSDPSLVHKMPKSTFWPLDFDDFSPCNLGWFSSPWGQIQTFKLFQQGFLETYGWTEPVGEDRLHNALGLCRGCYFCGHLYYFTKNDEKRGF